MSSSRVFFIRDSSYAGEIRRQASFLATGLGFSPTTVGNMCIVINELCSNLIKHASHGEVILSSYHGSIHLLALDKGKGMASVKRCMEDGYSTHGSPGTGLGAMRRLSSFFDIHSVEEKGTVVYAAFQESSIQAPFQVGAISLPAPGEEACGDAWHFVTPDDKVAKLLVADGLGHGLLAHEASQEAVKNFSKSSRQAPLEDIHSLHEALLQTRGAAVAVARIDFEECSVKYAGLGNISAMLCAADKARRLISFNGTAGVQLRKVREMNYPLTDDTLLVMFSDGLSSRLDVMPYRGLMQRHPALVAGVLYRDFCKGNDDGTVVVLRKRQRGRASLGYGA